MVKIVRKKLSKILKIVKMVKYCQNVGQVIYPHHSNQMRQGHRSQVSLFVFQNQKVSQWVSDKVTYWAVQGRGGDVVWDWGGLYGWVGYID